MKNKQIVVEGIVRGRSVEQMENELVEKIAEQIANIVADYAFPLVVLQDVNTRLMGNTDPYYAKQQLRYLQNVVNAGQAVRRERG